MPTDAITDRNDAVRAAQVDQVAIRLARAFKYVAVNPVARAKIYVP